MIDRPDGSGSTSQSSTLFVRNLPYDWTDLDLSSAFQHVGPIRRAFIVTSRRAERSSRGFGFVEFAVEDDARRAVVEMSGKMESGRKIKVEVAVKADKAKGLGRNGGERQSATQRKVHAKYVKAIEGDSMNGTVADIDADSETSDDEEEEQEEDDEVTFGLADAGVASSARPPSASSSVSILVSGISPSVSSLSDLLSSHSLHPTHVLFPAPESTTRYRAARLTFPSSALASAAMAALSSPSSSSSRRPLRCVVLPPSALRVIIRNLPFHITVRHVLNLLSRFTSSVSSSSIRLPLSTSSPTLNRGFAFVMLDKVEDAEAVVTGLTGKKEWGRVLAVDWSLGKKDYKVREEMAKKLEEKKEKRKEERKQLQVRPAEEKEEIKVQSEDEPEDEDDGGDDEVKVKSEDKGNVQAPEGSEHGDDEKSSNDEATTPTSPSSSSSSSTSSSNLQKGKKEASLSDPSDTSCTLFIRNLSYETTEQGLFDHFSLFGKVRYARIVMEKVEGDAARTGGKGRKREREEEEEGKEETEIRRRSKGVAFVRYARKEDADKVIALCVSSSAPISPSGSFSSASRPKPSLLSSLSESGILLDGRMLSVVPAVPKAAAVSFASSSARKQDKRNLYLAREGVVLSAAEGREAMSEEEAARRERWWREKKKKLENVNFMVSKVRLSVRNLPLAVDEKQVKAVFMRAVKEAMRDERRKERERRKAEEAEEKAALDRGEEIDEERWKRRRESILVREEKRRSCPIIIRQVKIVRDKERMTAAGVGRSKRFGFVEFSDHEHSLLALRWLNSNSRTAWEGTAGAGRSVMVEFAVDDVRKVKEREERQKRWEKMREVKARMIKEKEKPVQEETTEGEEAPEDEGEAGRTLTQKERKREAREKGVCFKCGEAGHQAKKCRRKRIKPEQKEGEVAQQANHNRTQAKAETTEPSHSSLKVEAVVRKQADLAGKRKRSEVEKTVKKKAKVSPASPGATEMRMGEGEAEERRVGKKRVVGDSEAKLSKREKRELESEARFDALVEDYKRKWMVGTAGCDGTEKKRNTSRWFDV